MLHKVTHFPGNLFSQGRSSKMAALLLAVMLLAAVVTGCGESKVKITPSPAAVLETEVYDNGLVSMKIPQGWEVTTIGDCSHYTIRVRSTDATGCQIFYNMKSEGYSKSQQAQQFWQTYYPDSGFSLMPVISEYTAECFFTIFNSLGALNNNETFTFPEVNDFTVVDRLGQTVFGGELLRAEFEGENGAACEGLFTAAVVDPGQYWINSNIYDFTSQKIDTYPLNVYNSIILSAPQGRLLEYEGILTECIGSLTFSQQFMQAFAQEQDTVLQQVQQNSAICNQISEGIMSGWEERNHAYDIASQKQSDATLGYERVVDTETGEVYRAYNGFTDGYSGKRYQPVTEEQYTQAVSGYIEK